VDPSPLYPLRAADLAAEAGDAAEEGDLLEVARERGSGSLSFVEKLVLARRAEARMDWLAAIDLYEEVAADAAAAGEPAAWVEDRLRRLEVDREASALRIPPDAADARTAGPEARLALAEARRALARGDNKEAREKLRIALRHAPNYVEAALALGALEERESRSPEAIRAYRTALAAEPDRAETLAALSNLLWDEPDRSAKQESLAMLDRAVALRPDLRALLRLSATRWAEWGDAARAFERLEAYRKGATPAERESTRRLHETLAARREGRGAPDPEPAGEASGDVPASPAVEQWKRALVYFRRGDEASLSAALGHLAEAERLDPTFARAPELAAAIHERGGNLERAEEALRRAVLADPFRVVAHERLARLLERRGRGAEALEAWRSAEEAGSTEALVFLARAEEEAGSRGTAKAYYERYLAEAPGGLHAEPAREALLEIERRSRRTLAAAAAMAALLLGGAVTLLARRRSRKGFAAWLSRDPTRAREARPIVGRLRHETIKHGGLLLSDTAGRLREGGDAARAAAELLKGRLFGSQGAPGLLAETRGAVAELARLARQSGVRLEARRDALLSPIVRACDLLAPAEPALERAAAGEASDAERVRLAERIETAARSLEDASGAALEAALDTAAATAVDPASLRDLADRVARETKSLPPSLETNAADGAPPRVRVPAGDWETIWRNLFANAIAAAREEGRAARLAIAVERGRDAITGEAFARVVLADDLPGTIGPEILRGREPDRGWGVVAELVRRHAGRVSLAPPPSAVWRKAIVIEFPAAEET
jgi:Tfp pilus assembly protein PilF